MTLLGVIVQIPVQKPDVFANQAEWKCLELMFPGLQCCTLCAGAPLCPGVKGKSCCGCSCVGVQSGAWVDSVRMAVLSVSHLQRSPSRNDFR